MLREDEPDDFVWGPGVYKVRIGTDFVTTDHWDKIPQSFDSLIAFIPEIPPGPHTPTQHAKISDIVDKMREIQARETK